MILANRYHYSESFINTCKARLNFALTHVPLYQNWRQFDPGETHSLDMRYDALPVLDKAAMRASFPDGLLPAGKDLQNGLESGAVEYTFTSGTTSEKVVNVFDLDWWSRSEAAAWKLHSVLAKLPHPQPTAKLASSLNVGINCEEDLPMSHRILDDTLYLNEKPNMLQWRTAHYARMVRELNEFRPAILEANPSLLARLSDWALAAGTAIVSPKAIVFTFEFSSKIALAAIRRVFSSPFISSYGSTETGFVLEECEAGLLHQNTKFCRIDFQPLKAEFGLPEVGRIFVTTFDNPWNCVIRFDVGDLVKLHPNGTCSCGRHDGMIVERIEGRTSNLTFTTRGGLVTTAMLDDRLAEVPEIRDYRLVQIAKKSYELEVMIAEHNAATMDRIQNILTGLYGMGGQFTVRTVENILPGPAGKFRRTQTAFDFNEEALFHE